jgi:adenylate cyclase
MSGDPDRSILGRADRGDHHSLEHWKGVPVIARNSTFTYKGRAVDVRQVAKELGARYILEGSIRKAGQRCGLRLSFWTPETGHHVWADKMDRRTRGHLRLQDEIATKSPQQSSPPSPGLRRSGPKLQERQC